MKDDKWKLLDRQVLDVIRLTLSKNVAHNVAVEKTTTGLMKALLDMYEKPSANNKVYLMKKLFNLKMKEGASVVEYLNSFNTVVNHLVVVEIKFEDEVCAMILLLPNSCEYVAVTEVSKEMIWLQSCMKELNHEQKKPVLYCDSQSAIHLAKNPVYHDRTKHIYVRFHFIRSALEDGVLKLEKILGSKNPADMLTKSVPVEKLKLCATSVELL